MTATRDRRAYMADYMRRRNQARRDAAIAALGGRCVECGTTELLQLDHIDPATKSFNLNRQWAAAESRFWAEVAKCQPLCKQHHEKKSARERSVEHGGGAAGKRRCKCDRCRAQKAAHNRQYKAARKAARKAAADAALQQAAS
jgi:hypothetical protein